jgi:hypothetical protein
MLKKGLSHFHNLVHNTEIVLGTKKLRWSVCTLHFQVTPNQVGIYMPS